MMARMEFADRIVEAQRRKDSIAVLGVDPHLDTRQAPGIPAGYSLMRFCCEVVEASADFVIAIKPQLAFFEARGIEGMRALVEILALARRLELLTIADAKRGDIGSTSAAYAEAFLGHGDFACDAVTVNPYLGSDAMAPFFTRARDGRGVFVLVKTSNASSGEFQDLPAPERPLWEIVAERVRGWGDDFIGKSGLSSIGAVVGATYPEQARRARELMPNALILVPGYGMNSFILGYHPTGLAMEDFDKGRHKGVQARNDLLENLRRDLTFVKQLAFAKGVSRFHGKLLL